MGKIPITSLSLELTLTSSSGLFYLGQGYVDFSHSNPHFYRCGEVQRQGSVLGKFGLFHCFMRNSSFQIGCCERNLQRRRKFKVFRLLQRAWAKLRYYCLPSRQGGRP